MPQTDNKIHYSTDNGLMYYDGCPIIKKDGDFLTYEEFMLPKQANTKEDPSELIQDIKDEKSELD